MAIFWKSKILLAKIEASYAADSAPTGADNAILATNVSLSPMEGQDVSRELELPWLAAQATIPAGLHSRISFRVELVGSGNAGIAPAWGPLLRMCGVSQTVVATTSVTYRPVTDGHESGTIHFWVGPTRYVLRGTRGTAVIRLNAQGIAVIEFTFTGLFALPGDVVRPTPNLSSFREPKIVSSANTPLFTVDTLPFVLRDYSFDLGNDVQTRFLIGSESVRIVDKPRELVSFQVEAVPMDTYNPFAAALDEDPIEVKIQHESAPGRVVTITHPATQPQRPGGLANQQNITEWPLRHVPLPTNGNDQWALALT